MRYLSGELNINYVGRDKLIIANTHKHLCQCGCGGYVEIKRHHYSMGIPKFIHGHNARLEEHRKLSSEMRSKCIGPLHSHYKKDRSQIKGPRRWAYCFTKYQRRQIYIREQGICQSCGAFTIWNVDVTDPLKTNIDHIVDIQFGGLNELSNGRVLCLMCHKLKHSVTAKTANSEDAKAKAMPTPSQAEIISPACVETNVQSSKEMI